MRRMNRKRVRQYRAKKRFKQRIRIFAKRLRRQIRFFIKDRYFKKGRLNFIAVFSDIWKVASAGYKLFKNLL